MPFCLRNVLSESGPHIRNTLVEHQGDMRVMPKMALQGLISLGLKRHLNLGVYLGYVGA